MHNNTSLYDRGCGLKMSNAEFCKGLDICMREAHIENAYLAKKLNVSSSLVSAWRRGERRFLVKYLKGTCDCLVKEIGVLHPQVQKRILKALKEEFNVNPVKTGKSSAKKIEQILLDIQESEECLSNSTLNDLRIGEDAADLLSKINHNKKSVVVFDFDGTLTKKKELNSIWEEMWVKLGYSKDLCRLFHTMYDKKEISHQKWCDITCEHFKARNFNSSILDDLSKDISLLPNTDKLFHELRTRNIDIYKNVLGELNSYVKDTRANEMLFTREGYLYKINGTEYDFEGKAKYIKHVLGQKAISPKDVLFVGNSKNDEYAKSSGATTLCINPTETDLSNAKIWDYVIKKCDDALDILPFFD